MLDGDLFCSLLCVEVFMVDWAWDLYWGFCSMWVSTCLQVPPLVVRLHQYLMVDNSIVLLL